MGLMQSGSNFTDRIVKYVAKWAERKTKPASPSRGHAILPLGVFSIRNFNLRKLKGNGNVPIDAFPLGLFSIRNFNLRNLKGNGNAPIAAEHYWETHRLTEVTLISLSHNLVINCIICISLLSTAQASVTV